MQWQRRILAFALALFCSAFVEAQQPQAAAASPNNQTVLAADTSISLRTTRALTSKQVKPGEQVDLEVVRDVRVGSLLVIPRHTKVTGTVYSVQPARRLMRGGSIGLEPADIKAITGETVALKGNRTAHGGPSAEEKAGAVLEGRIILSWLPLVMKGEEASLPKGTAINAFVNSDVLLDTARLREAVAALEQKKAALLAAGTQAEVHIYRHIPDVGPGKATIYLDGNQLARIGQGRYLSLLLDPGAHTFRVDRSEVRLECKAGEEYYLLTVVHRSFWGEARGTHGPVYLTLVQGEQAEDEIYPLRLPDAKDIKDPSKLVKSDMRP
jgi:hypothetical protein